MNYRYRVKGVAEKSFILRGMYFAIGSSIDTDISANELTFVKERCKIAQIVDKKAETENLQPILNNSQTNPKEVKNELPKSTTSGANKSTNKAKV